MKRLRPFVLILVLLAAVACAPPSPRMAGVELQGLRASVEVESMPGMRVSYLRSRNSADVLVIWVHGTPGDAEGWADYMLEPLAGTVSVALDRPGFGQSAPQDVVTDLEQQVAAVVALFPPTPSKVVLVGHSLGGAVVAQVAARYPERVRGLVLLASSLDPAQEVIHPVQYLGRLWPVSRMLPRALRNANDELMAFKGELLKLQPLLPMISAPTVIVHGTRDGLFPFANVAYMQTRLSSVYCLKTMVLQDQNHFLPWNSEATVRVAVRWAVSQGSAEPEPC